MKVRPLIIDDGLKTAVKRIIEYAETDPYIVGESAVVPGDNPNHVLKTHFGYRCVFSFTRVSNGLFRDLSISVSQKGKWPNPFAAYELATLFGFTGWDHKTIEPTPSDWLIAKDTVWDAIRIAQPISTGS